MIKVTNLTMKFDDFTALNNLCCEIPGGCIYGMVGSNGAGKSTLLRLIMGIYRPKCGEILVDGEPVFDNPATKARMVFVPDELFFLPQCSMERMAKLYSDVYPKFSNEKFESLTKIFGLDPKKSLNTFSKGMRRQAATILALSCMCDYIFLDETFDGLDPVMRNLVKKVLYSDILERNATVVLTSHSLRELEDTCDQLALLHKGGIIFESDVENLKTSLFKMQVAFEGEYDKSKFKDIDIMNFTKHGMVSNLIIRGDREATEAKIRAMNPILCEVLSLSLEEVFIYEMDALGYEFKDVLV